MLFSQQKVTMIDPARALLEVGDPDHAAGVVDGLTADHREGRVRRDRIDERARAGVGGQGVVDSAERVSSNYLDDRYFIGQINPLSGLLREIRLEAGRIVQKIKHQL